MEVTENLDPRIKAFILEVTGREAGADTEPCGLNRWLEVLLRDCGGIADRLIGHEATLGLRDRVAQRKAAGDAGEPLPVSRAIEHMHNGVGAGEAPRLGHLVAALLKLSGATVAPPEAPASAAAAPVVAPPDPVKEAPPPSEEPKAVETKATRPTPTIDKLGRDLTVEARAGKLPPVVGRDGEIDTLVETLCRETKRNPLLIGPPGSGKTAIVEAFASRVAAGQVPALLAGVRVLAVETSAIVGGTQYSGAIEERMQKIIKEASQPNVVLFIDEAHTIMSGRGPSVMADSLKPALARGEIAVIAATTDEEYRALIKPDGALERRFQPIVVLEMDAARTLDVMKVRRDAMTAKRGIAADDVILAHLVDFAAEHMRNRVFPDKAFDLLEQCVAFVVSHGGDRVTREVADRVMARQAGAVISPADALTRALTALLGCGVSQDEDRQQILSRIRTTLNHLDVRAWRPNLVLGLVGEAAAGCNRLAAGLAEALFGSERRVVTLDLSPIRDEEGITLLVGPPPGYVGFNRPLAIHELALTPRCAIVVTGADVCHPAATQIVAQAIRQGYITDSTNARYHLSDAIVIVAASPSAAVAKRLKLGFTDAARPGSVECEPRDPVELFGHALAEQFDLVLSLRLASGDGVGENWIRKQFIPDVAERYLKRGVELSLDDGAVTALLRTCDGCSNYRERERVAEEWVSSLVLEHLKTFSADTRRKVLLTTRDGVAVVADQE